MNKLKVNKKYTVNISEIKKFVVKKDCVWIYRKNGYPKILISDFNAYSLRLRLVNMGINIKNFKVEEKI